MISAVLLPSTRACARKHARTNWIAAPGLLSLWLLAAAAVAQAPPAPPTPSYWLRVRADDVNIRCRPDVESLIVHQVNSNTVLEALGQEGGWHRIVPPPGTFALVSSAYVKMSGPTTGTVATSTGSLRARAGSTQQEVDPMITDVLVLLESGSAVTVLGQQGDFYKITPPPGSYFYVSQDFVEAITPEAARALMSGAAPAGATAAAPAVAPPGANAATSQSATLPPIRPAPTPAAAITIDPPVRRGLEGEAVARDAEIVPLATSTGQLEDAPASQPAGATPDNGVQPAPNANSGTPRNAVPLDSAVAPANAPSGPAASGQPAAPAAAIQTPGPKAGIVPPPPGSPPGQTITTPVTAPPPANVSAAPAPIASPGGATPMGTTPISATPGGTTGGARTYSLPQQYPTTGPVTTISRTLTTARGILRPALRVPIGPHGLRYGLFDPYTRRASIYAEFPIALGLNLSDAIDKYVIVEGEAYADSTTRAPVIRVEYITITDTRPGRGNP